MKPTISLASNTASEQNIQVELEALLATKDLTPWCFTTQVLIDEATLSPHSHPVLTLDTRSHDRVLLANYVHEQLHWFCRERGEVVDALIHNELQELYAVVPVGVPDGCRYRWVYATVLEDFDNLAALYQSLEPRIFP